MHVWRDVKTFFLFIIYEVIIIEPSIVSKVHNKSDFNGLKLFPQEALICYLENKRNKIFIWPREPLMGISFLSYGENIEIAKENIDELLDYIPANAFLMQLYMKGYLMSDNPKEITFEEIKMGIEKNTRMIALGETNAIMLRPVDFIEHLLEQVNDMFNNNEEKTKEFLLDNFHALKEVLSGWLE
jgi:hypothetical protein